MDSLTGPNSMEVSDLSKKPAVSRKRAPPRQLYPIERPTLSRPLKISTNVKLTKFGLVLHDHNYGRPQCDKCCKTYYNFVSLRSHIKNCHSTTMIEKHIPRLKCAVSRCEDRFQTNQSYFNHLKSKHDIVVKSEELSFSTEEEVTSWIDNARNSYSVGFNKQGIGRFKTWYGHVTRYNCECNGFFKPNKNYKGERFRESKKVNGRCPASFTVKYRRHCSDGKLYIVKFITTHVGHVLKPRIITINERHLRRLNDLSIGENSESSKNDLPNDTNKSALMTIEDENIGGGLVDDGIVGLDEIQSIILWVERLRKTGHVLHFRLKPKFGLVIMTDHQRQILTKYGRDCLLVDTTHDISKFGLYLTLLTVIDLNKRGHIVAYFFSKTYAEEDMEIFFSTINREFGELYTDLFLSDFGYPSYFDAFINVFGINNVGHKVVPSFYVWKLLEKDLQSIDHSHRTVIRGLLKEIEKEVCETLFTEKTDQLSNYLQQNSCPTIDKFHELLHEQYFDSNFITQWAYYAKLQFRRAPILMNHVESYKRRLKILELPNNETYRMDKFVSEIYLAQMRLEKRELAYQLDDYYKVLKRERVTIVRLHQAGLLLKTEIQKTGDELKFHVTSESQPRRKYLVEKVADSCECSIKCKPCGFVCIHTWRCQCQDYVEQKLCKHIHHVLMGKDLPFEIPVANIQSDHLVNFSKTASDDCPMETGEVDDEEVNNGIKAPDSKQVEDALAKWNEILRKMMKSEQGFEYQLRLLKQVGTDLEAMQTPNENKL